MLILSIYMDLHCKYEGYDEEMQYDYVYFESKFEFENL